MNTEGPQYKNIEETARVYEEYINANGGIGGRPLEANFCDARGTPTGVAACGRESGRRRRSRRGRQLHLSPATQIIPILEKGKTAQWV